MKKREKIKPKYITWYEDAFQAELRVRHMRPIQRHFYRSLLIQASYCSTRPYLPDDDSQLWMLADADSLEHWKDHAPPVRAMFQPVTISGMKLLSQKRLLKEWETMEAIFSGKGYNSKKMQAAPAGTPVDTPVEAASHPRRHQNRTDPKRTRTDRNLTPADPFSPDMIISERSEDQAEADQLTDQHPNTASQTATASASVSQSVVQSASRTTASSAHSEKKDGQGQSQFGAGQMSGQDGNAMSAFSKPVAAVGSGKPITAKIQTFDDEEDGVWQGMTSKTLVNNYWAVARKKPDSGKWCGAKTEADVECMRSIVQMHGTDKVKMVIEHLGRTDYWGCHEKGKVDGIKGLGRALEAIYAQAQSYVQKVKKTKLGVPEL